MRIKVKKTCDNCKTGLEIVRRENAGEDYVSRQHCITCSVNVMNNIPGADELLKMMQIPLTDNWEAS